jgi:hypothetical protein
MSWVQSRSGWGVASSPKIFLKRTEGGMNILQESFTSGSPVTTACHRRQSAPLRIWSSWVSVERRASSASCRFVTSVTTPARIPLARPGGPYDDLLAQPMDTVGADDPEFVLIAPDPSSERLLRPPVHLLVVRGELVLPQPTLAHKGGQPVDWVVPELGRGAENPVEPARLLGRRDLRPPQQDVGPVERVQDQLVVLKLRLAVILGKITAQDLGFRKIKCDAGTAKDPQRTQRRSIGLGQRAACSELG